ncbi:MAG TPA: hypothetical protein VE891_09845 [Allosphingosinicella sp.]|nr:hypothetical protein [Allosphingosinicella sp.]
MDARDAFALLLVALMILPAVAVAGYRYRRALRERDRRKNSPP